MKQYMAAVLFLVPAILALAGEPRYSAAWKGKFVVVPQVTRPDIWQLSPAEQRRADAFCAAVTAIFRQDPFLIRTAGYSVHIRRGFTEPSSWVRDLRPPYLGYNIQYWMQAAVSPILRREGRLVDPEDSSCSLQLSVNNLHALYRHYRLSDKGLQDRYDSELFLEPQLLSGSGTVRRYDNNLVIIHKRPVPPWFPVSRGEYLQALVDKHDPARGGRDANAYMAEFFRKELAALSPARRKSPARYVQGSESPSGLIDGEGGRPLVRINPGFFARAKPRTAVQCIVFHYSYFIPEGRMAAAAASFARGGAAWVLLQLQKTFAVERLAGLVE